MKKNFFKKLSFVLVLAMVLSVFAPVGAFAAKGPKLNAAKKYLLLDVEGRDDHSFKLSGVAKGATVKWRTGNAKVATVSKNGVVTAKGVGGTRVAADVTTNGKTVKVTAKVIVYDNVAELEITDLPEADLKVGVEHDFDKAYTTVAGSKTKTSSKIKWSVEDKDGKEVTGAKINSGNGIFVAEEAGEYTIVARAFQSNAKFLAWDKNKELDYVLVEAKTTVKVVPSVVDVKQTEANKFEIEFDSDVKDLVKKDNVTLVDGNGINVTSIIKSVAVDGKKATVETFINLTDKAVYTGKAAGMDYEFTASNGEVAKIKIVKPSKAVINTSTPVEYELYDANGVKVSGEANKVSFSIANLEDSVSVITNDGNITMFEAGKVASVKAKYATGKYDAEWKEITIDSEPFAIEAVKALTVGAISDWGIFDAYLDDNAPKETDFKEAVKVLPLEVTGKRLAIFAKDSAGKQITADKVEYESTNSLVLLVDKTGNLIPIKDGVAGVVVKIGEFKAVIQVTVGAASKATSIAIDKNQNRVVLSTNADINHTFDVVVKDQYGNEMTLKDTSSELLGTAGADNSAMAGFIFNPKTTGLKAGTYNYRLKANGLSIVVTVVVQIPDGVAATYRFEIADVDTTVNKDTTPGATLNVKVYSYDKNGVKFEDVTSSVSGTGIKIVGVDGTTNLANGDDIYTVTGGAITGKTKAQRYTVTGQVAVGGELKNIVPAYFNVTDSQKPLVVTQTESVVSSTTALASAFALPQGATATIKSVVFEAIGKTAVVKSVKVRQEFGTVYLEYDVTVNKAITLETAAN